MPFGEIKGRRLLHCLNCDLVYVERAKKQRRFSGESEKKFLKEYLSQEKHFREYFKKILGLIEKHQPPGFLLDIGSGAGLFLKEAEKRGWQTTGIEPAITAANYATGLGLEVKKTSFEKVKSGFRKFDLVTVFQTIEHMEAPLEVFQKARVMLKPRGLLVVMTPNRESLLAKMMGKRWFGYYNEEHQFFFNQKSLQLGLKKAGFQRAEIKIDSGRWLTPSWVLTRLTDYYYDHRSKGRGLMTKFRPVWRYLDWFKFKEPAVNLLAFAWKKE